MPQPDLVAMNAAMRAKIIAEPLQPLADNGYALRVVHTTGRRTGRRRSTPLGVVQTDGTLYLVTPDRTRDWVRNVDADPAVTLDPGDDARLAVPAAPDESARAVAVYLRAMRVPWALRAFPLAQNADIAEITDHLDTIGVYRLDTRH